MSFRKGLAGADVPSRVLLCVERELNKLLHGGTSLGVNMDEMAEMAEIAEVAEKSGKSGRIFFLALVVVTLMHQFFRSSSRFPVLATATRFSQTPDSRRSAGDRESRATRLATPGMEVSCRCGHLLLLPGLLRWATNAYPRCLCRVPGRQVMGSQQSGRGRLSMSDSLQRESWHGDDSTLSVLPFHIRPRFYYITVFDVVALISWKSRD